MSDPIKCPECIQGKHANCGGEAYDFATESTVPCDCQCIGDSYKAALQPSPQQSDVRSADRAGEAQDGRTTAEWISDLVKARQAAEAEVAEVRLGRAELADEVQALRDQVANLPDRTRAAEAEVERLTAKVDHWKDLVQSIEVERDVACASIQQERVTEKKRADKAESTVARVEALGTAWGWMRDDDKAPTRLEMFAALRAALADPEPAQVQQSDEAGDFDDFDRMAAARLAETEGVRFCDDDGTITNGPGVGWPCTGSVHFDATLIPCASENHHVAERGE